MRETTCWSTPVGPLSAVWEEGKLTTLWFGHHPPTVTRLTPAQSQFGKELAEYFNGSRRAFACLFSAQGTPFQRKVWTALLKIPYGETRTYSQIAKMVGRPSAQRAVGNAVGKNPLPVLIPCHRVVRSDGTLGGFSGGVGIKPLLLALEGVVRFSAAPVPAVPNSLLSFSSIDSCGKTALRRTRVQARSQSKRRSSLPSLA
jgi:methylated-DNA-[protein]-cysteine S-methyltransferase